MQKINNDFQDYYYLLENGNVYNSNNDKTIQPDKRHMFCLYKKDGTKRKISLKTLYKLVYHKPYCKDSIANLNNEIWKQIDNTDKLYYISNKGRVKSLQGYEAIILKPFNNKGGYLRVDIIEDGIRQTRLVHRLVAAAFLPLPKNINMQLHHIDLNKNNNAVENLQWLSAADHLKKHKKGNIKNVSSKSKENHN